MITREEAKQNIVFVVTEKQGCEFLDLMLCAYQWNQLQPFLYFINNQYYPNTDKWKDSSEVLKELVDELIQESRLIVITYTIPSLNHQERNFLLPIGSNISIKQGK